MGWAQRHGTMSLGIGNNWSDPLGKKLSSLAQAKTLFYQDRHNGWYASTVAICMQCKRRLSLAHGGILAVGDEKVEARGIDHINR